LLGAAMENKNEVDSANASTFKKPVAIIVVIGALSLATWYFFYLEAMPLTPPETAFVVGGWVALVLVAKWLWGRLHRKDKSGAKR
jgi:hypothetical protein